MKVLIVGCGAVGQVFGLFLQKAGAELGLYDRPATTHKLKLALEQGGLPIFQIAPSRGKESVPHRLEHYQVLMDEVDCQRFQPDLIWFTTPSQVYHSEWFREFLQKVPSERVVCFTPEGRRPEFFPEREARDRLVFGGIIFMAWQGDLEGGGGQAGAVNFWVPPLLGFHLAGTEKAGGDVEKLLKKAGFRVTLGNPDSHMQGCITAVLTSFVAGLELSGWLLKSYRKTRWLKTAARAAREAALGQLAKAGFFTRVLLRILLSSPMFHAVTLFLPLPFPFDLEKYLKFHYLKTRDQTLMLLELFAKDAERSGVPNQNIRILYKRLLEAA